MGFTCVELQLPVRNNIVSRGFSLQILPIEAKNYSRPMRNKLVHSASYRRAKERNSKSHPRLGILHSELIRRVVDPPNGASCGRQLKTQILRQRSLGTKIQSPMIQRFANTSTKDLAQYLQALVRYCMGRTYSLKTTYGPPSKLCAFALLKSKGYPFLGYIAAAHMVLHV